MVDVILNSSSVASCCNYNLSKINSGTGKIISMENCMYDIDDVLQDNDRYSLSCMMRNFSPFIYSNDRAKNKAFHVSLNPVIEESAGISDETYAAIAKDYMEKMGYGEVPYVVFRHNDIERQHIHILSVRIGVDGKKINDSFEHLRSNKTSREIESKYGLATGFDKKRSYLDTLDASKEAIINETSLLARTRKAVRLLLSTYYKDLDAFNKALAEFGLMAVPSFSNNRKCLVYYEIDKNGKRCSVGLPSSRAGAGCRLADIEAKIGTNYEDARESARTRIKDIILNFMNDNFEFSWKYMIEEMEKKDITMKVFRNEDGYIFGLRFVDKCTGISFKASDIDRKFSAAGIRERAVYSDDSPYHAVNRDLYRKLFKLFSSTARNYYAENKKDYHGYSSLYYREISRNDDKLKMKISEAMVNAGIVVEKEKLKKIYDKWNGKIAKEIPVAEMRDMNLFNKKISGVVNLLKIVDHEKAGELLYRLGFKVVDDGRYLCDLYNENLKIPLSALCDYKVRDFDPKNKKPYGISMENKVLLNMLANGDCDFGAIKIPLHNSTIFKYLDKDNQIKFVNLMIRAADSQVKSVQNITIYDYIDRLYSMGVGIDPVYVRGKDNGGKLEKNYVLRFADYKGIGAVFVSAEVRKALDSIDYENTQWRSRTAEISTWSGHATYKYRLEASVARLSSIDPHNTLAVALARKDLEMRLAVMKENNRLLHDRLRELYKEGRYDEMLKMIRSAKLKLNIDKQEKEKQKQKEKNDGRRL